MNIAQYDQSQTITRLIQKFDKNLIPFEDTGRVAYVLKDVGIGKVKHTIYILAKHRITNEIMCLHHNKDFERPRLATLNEIRDGREAFYDEDYYQPYDLITSLKRAWRTMLNWKKYSPLFSNCHMFTNYVCYGKAFSKPVQILGLITAIGAIGGIVWKVTQSKKKK